MRLASDGMRWYAVAGREWSVVENLVLLVSKYECVCFAVNGVWWRLCNGSCDMVFVVYLSCCFVGWLLRVVLL